MPTIRVDQDVFAWLQSLARPLEDSPNSVLRRVAGFENSSIRDAEQSVNATLPKSKHLRIASSASTKFERVTGDQLRKLWKVPVKHALYHRDGTFFENLVQFPGALFDWHGYVVFDTEQEYNDCSHLYRGRKLNVPGGIASIPGYVRKR
jgi:hypothetical protein